MSTVIRIAEPSRAALPGRGFALWQLGFRPFYLLASVFAASSIALWAAQFAGWLGRPYLAGPIWHAHEMLFGFALAVVVGFLFTAGRNWSNRPTPTGLWLAALAALWVAGRVLVLTPFGWAAACVDSAFPLAAAVGLAIPFAGSKNRRNHFFVVLLVLMAAIDFAFHLSLLGAIDWPAFAGLQLGLDALLFIMAVMAGRVVPMFTNNGVPGAGATRLPLLDKVALALLLALLAADALHAPGPALAVVALAGALAHAWRWALWRPWKTTRAPLVWVLHAGYAWIAVHLALRAAAALGWIAASPAIHALGVGAAGCLIVGMMTRTSRGHTGRPLRADRFDVACYLMVLLAALVRVFVPLAAPPMLRAAVLASGGLWAAAFTLFAIRYAPSLIRRASTASPADREGSRATGHAVAAGLTRIKVPSGRVADDRYIESEPSGHR